MTDRDATLSRKERKAAARTKADGDTPKDSWWDLIKLVLSVLAIVFVLRTFIFQPFHIPSGSMEPGLVEGDYLVTSKYSVGYGKYSASPLPFPKKEGRLMNRNLERGEVIVFRPVGISDAYIKRLIGLPGDRIQMINGVLHINGSAVKMEPLGQAERQRKKGGSETVDVFQETLPNGRSYKIYDADKNYPTDNTQVFTVPEGSYMMMGDNRDRSADSRLTRKQSGIGYVPEENLIGRAEFILASGKPEWKLFNPLSWYKVRGDRWFKRIR